MSKWGNWVPAFAGTTMVMLLLATPAQAGGKFPGVGRPATPAEVKAWDIDVRPDFQGLPAGSGSVQAGQKVWDEKCASCHGTFGESNEVFPPLVGGTTAEDIRTGRVKALAKGEQRTTLMKLSTVSTLWDYVNRAMPWNAPKSLTTEEVYAVVAYLLHLGDILPADFVLSDRNIAEVQQRLPNRNGVTREHGLWDVRGKPDVANVACMKNCGPEPRIASSMPDHARDSHGNLAEQMRPVGPVRGITVTESRDAPGKAAALGSGTVEAGHIGFKAAELASRQACMSCHAVERRVVGPSFREVAKRYNGQAGIDALLAQKVRGGTSGTWGSAPMPPNPALTDAEAKGLVQWILEGAPS
jgi:cytochrome c551/c552/cytochrome c553